MIGEKTGTTSRWKMTNGGLRLVCDSCCEIVATTMVADFNHQCPKPGKPAPPGAK